MSGVRLGDLTRSILMSKVTAAILLAFISTPSALACQPPHDVPSDHAESQR